MTLEVVDLLKDAKTLRLQERPRRTAFFGFQFAESDEMFLRGDRPLKEQQPTDLRFELLV